MLPSLIDLRTLTVQLFEQLGLSNYWAVLLQSIVAVVVVILLSWLLGYIGKRLMQRIIPPLVQKSRNRFDDVLLHHDFFNILSYYLFGIVFFSLDSFIASEGFRAFAKAITGTYFTVVTLLLINVTLNAFYDIYQRRRRGKHNNIKIYLQLIKVILFSLGGVVIISFFANKNFMDILKGLGAMLTILLIVYKDTILGFVAGISLSANKMLKEGDWISLPKHNADGVVIDIGLNAVRVQNWDKTITTIPPYILVSDSFTNWIGMEEAAGRRIKRHLYIDVESVRFLTDTDIERLKNCMLIKDYLNEKTHLVAQAQEQISEPVNQRRLTNLGTFKKYIECYLLSTGYVNTEMTFMVRQLQSTEKGIPMEIYFFCTEKEWVNYEQVQSDIYDHLFAIVREFDLRIFQNVSSSSLRNFTDKRLN